MGSASWAGARKASLLDDYPAIRTQSRDETAHLLRSIYGARSFALIGGQSEFSVHANHKPVTDISLSYCGYEGTVEIEFPEASFARQMFRISGTGTVNVGLSGPQMAMDGSVVLPPNVPLRVRFSDGFQQLLLRIDQAALIKKLTALLGSEPAAALQFSPIEPEDEGNSLLRNLVMSLAQGIHTLERYGGATPVVPELEQAIIATFLVANQSNYSDRLRADPKDAGPWQVRAVEDYLVSHWNEPVDMLQLVKITGASARSIYKAFARTRGYSPKMFLKRTRLKRAREKLQSSDPKASVTAIALACGFHNLGHFARDYRESFGELPSETLAKQQPARSFPAHD